MVWDTAKSFIANVLTHLLDFLLWIFWGEASALQPGQSPESPLEVQAVPGLTTLLDIALYRSVEAELTGTIHASHVLLQTWLDVQAQSRRVMQFLKQRHNPQSGAPTYHGSGGGTGGNNSHQEFCHQLELFSRACYEGSCDVLERMFTDRFAQTANLSDAYDGSGNNMMYGNLATGTGGYNFEGAHHNNSHHHHGSAAQQDFILSALHESSCDTGRRRVPRQQRPRDCWESARLYCPDYVWGDEVIGLCQKTTRHLAKHSCCSVAFVERHTVSDASSSGADSSMQQGGGNRNLPVSYLTNTLEREEATLLLQLVLVDAPSRLSHFKAALESESVVSKRLYLIKSEYRAPLRAFWEAHSSVQRAPGIELVEESLQRLSSSGSSNLKDKRNSNKNAGDSAAASEAKSRLQKLLETPELVELVAMERQIEQYELDMALALFPFCELARYLDQKKAALRKGADANLVRTLARLKSILVAGTANRQSKTNAEYPLSGGIRPLLLDFQGVPRDDDEEDERRLDDAEDDLKSAERMGLMDGRLDDFVTQLKFLSKLCSEEELKNAFRSEKKTEIYPPTASHCRKFDGELFKCHVKDWYTMATRQHKWTTETITNPDSSREEAKMEVLAEEIRRAEMAVSFSMVPTESALRKVKDRVQMISSDRTKRFDILKESLEDLCLREMNWHLNLIAPPVEQVLELRPTDSAQIPAMAGLFGIPLLQAKQVLPLG